MKNAVGVSTVGQPLACVFLLGDDAGMKPINAALIGYGNAARIFHAPLITGVPGLRLDCICSSKPQAVLADWPQVRVVSTPQAAFADPSVDLVVIATGNESHHPLAREALLAGKHVVVDKPCTVTLAQTQELLQIARDTGKTMTVFQNRRWDADFLALQQVLDSGVLGRIVYFESHFDRYRPIVPDRWREQNLPGSGLWFDLGAHLVDQCLQLFGAPDDIQVDLACQRDGAKVNDYFHAQLRYATQDATRHPGLRVLLHASALVPAVGPRFVVHGTLGSFVKYGLDVQEDALKAGGRPHWGDTAAWGHDPLVGSVTTHTDRGLVVIPAPDRAGNYLAYYAQLCEHLQGRAPAPSVTPEQVEMAMRLLAQGEHSAALGQFVSVGAPVGVGGWL
jgi:predicted dehydrogenase